jgi:molybdopterin-guanine dinucleotide biosynthesis protein A
MSADKALGPGGVPSPASGFDAVILAGGRGSRAGGVDKPGLVVNGRAMLRSVVEAACGAGAARVIVVGPQRRDVVRGLTGGGERVSFVVEEPRGAGPVAALGAGLAAASARVVVLLAADLPFLRGEHVESLLGAMGEGGAGAFVVDEAGQPQWLVSCWRAGELRAALRAYEGRSLRGVLGRLGAAPVRWPVSPGEPPPWLDCDTPGDLARARWWAARGRAAGLTP